MFVDFCLQIHKQFIIALYLSGRYGREKQSNAFPLYQRVYMTRNTIKMQLKNNFVAIISLTVAIIALLYTAWREETTERNRTTRTAGFEVLMRLGELQIIVNHVYYQKDNVLANPYLGWGQISLISDLSQLLPQPVPETVKKLLIVWSNNWKKISTDEKATTLVSDQIDTSRKEVLESIRYLR